MNEAIAAAINKQVNMELFSAYLYLSIANYYISQKLDGFGNWFTVQTQEERDHAMLMVGYLQNNDEPVTLTEISAPKGEYADYRSPLEAALTHEKAVTRAIHAIYGKALETGDYRTTQFLDWFIKEQGEEEKNVGDLLDRYNLFGTDAKSLYLLNSELAARTYVAPTLVL